MASAVVPFTSSYRGLWLGLGAVAFDLIVALVVTSLLRQRIGHRVWRTVHWAAYLSWPIAFVHGLGTGSDGRVGWVQGVDLVCLVVVLAAVGWRLGANWQLDPARRAAGALGSAVVLVLVLGWAATGPTQAGWARKAGTPRSLLGSARALARPRARSGAAGSGSPTTTPPGALAPSRCTPQLQGTIAQTGDGGAARSPSRPSWSTPPRVPRSARCRSCCEGPPSTTGVWPCGKAPWRSDPAASPRPTAGR